MAEEKVSELLAARYAELVERLKPSWRADEDASRAASLLRSTSPALVERLNASIVANNEIKAEAAAAITALEARCEQLEEALRQLLRCEYDGPGMRDCTDNSGAPYQSADLAARIAESERLLVSIESKP